MEQAIKELVEHTNRKHHNISVNSTIIPSHNTELTYNTIEKLSTLPPGDRLLISVSGIPGSGKTTLAKKVLEGLNAISKSGGVAAMIPMVSSPFPPTAPPSQFLLYSQTHDG